MTENPYKSPQADGYADSPKRRSPRGLSGPLLVFGTVLFIVAVSTSAMSFVPEAEETHAYITGATGIASLLCFGLVLLAFSRREPPNSNRGGGE